MKIAPGVLLLFLLSCSSGSYMERVPKTSESSYSSEPRILRIDSSVITDTKLEQRIQQLIDTAKVTGLCISIFNNNEVVYKKAFGKANAANEVALKTNHTIYGASFSKAVFGYIVADLVQDGRIDLDRPLQEYLDFPIPQLKSDDKWRGFQDLKNDRRYEKITARMCLSHTTGFQNWRWIPRPGESKTENKLKIHFDPGSEYSYSGEGIMLLQYVIEHITGIQLEQMARERVFEPFHMDMTSYTWQNRFEEVYCHGHTTKGSVIKKDKRNRADAAGSMETTLDDYSKFIQHILKLSSNNSEITNQMFTPNINIDSKAQFGSLAMETTSENKKIELSYGLGWGLLKSPYGFGAFKEGHGEGFQHYSILFPEKQIGVVIMSNSDNAESIFKKLLEISIRDIYTPWKWENYVPFDE